MRERMSDLSGDVARSRPLHRLVIVDPHPIVREGLGRVASLVGGIEVVASVDLPEEAERLMATSLVTVAIVTLEAGDRAALSCLRRICDRYQGLGVLALAARDLAELRPHVLEAGALGVVSKHAPTEVIAAALRDVIAGRVSDGDERADTAAGAVAHFESVSNAPRPGTPSELLSGRELEVFEHLGSGRTAREVAQTLGLSVKTIASHRANIQAKLGIRTLAELFRCAVLWREHQARSQPGGLGGGGRRL